MFSTRFALGFLLTSAAAVAQQYVISTVAGGGVPNNLSATSISFGPQKVAVDGAGNLFIVDLYAVYRVSPAGLATIVAGNGKPGFSGDGGLAPNAQINSPRGIALDAQGNIYIADTNNYCVRRVNSGTGIITTVAGTPGNLKSGGDGGPATSAQVGAPEGIAVDGDGNIYVSDVLNYRIRKVSAATGIISTYVGTGSPGHSGDGGPATAAMIYQVPGLATDKAGDLYLLDNGVRRVSKESGVITTIEGSVSGGDISLDSSGNIYLVSGPAGTSLIQKVDATTQAITTIAGGNGGYSGDGGVATKAQLYEASGVTVDAGGNIYIADKGNYRVRKITAATGIITTIAGTGDKSFSGDNGPATNAQLDLPGYIAVDTFGNLYINDQGNARIRKVTATTGTITTVAGSEPPKVSCMDGGPTTACQISPSGLAVDAAGNIFFVDSFTSKIRKVSATDGTITSIATIALSNNSGLAGGLALDSSGNFYLTNQAQNQILKIAAGTGAVTVIGGSGASGFSGDGGPAVMASFNMGSWEGAGSLAVDRQGNVYVADTSNNRVRRIDAATSIVTTVAGSGATTFIFGQIGDGGPAINALLSDPTGIALDPTGNIYIGDSDNYRIRKVDTSGIITTIAGNGTCCFSAEAGPATGAELSYGFGLALDAAGNILVSDTFNNRVRKLTPLSLGVNAATNGASNLSGPIAPGEIVVLYGSGLGPGSLVKATVGSNGLYPTQLAGTSVQINGIQAPMIYAWATQVAAVVPYGVTGTTAQVTVTYQGQSTATSAVPIAPSAPGIFSLDSTGSGQAAAINQDGFTVNTAASPAKIGDIISLYATGEGQTTPGGVDGKPAGVPLPQPNLPVSVTIGGQQTAKPQYAGGAPGEIAGVMQINVQIPTGIQTGNAVPVVLTVGNASSQPGLTIAVR